MKKLSDLNDPGVIRKAIEEFDMIGRNAFLEKYSFGRADAYFLSVGGRLYDSKAIVGAAYGLQFPRQGPLVPSDFRGGKATVKRKLEKLGFTVVVAPTSSLEVPIVLVENEITAGGRYDDWKDVTGERYHFPNQYRNLIVEGRQFVYYRGIRRQGQKRGPAEYFGLGCIGSVYPDAEIPAGTSKRNQKWYAEIEDYRPFVKPVPAKIDGEFLERIPKNFWGVGVRKLPLDVFEKILSLSGTGIATVVAPSMPPIEKIVPVFLATEEYLLAKRKKGESKGGSPQGGTRRSPYAKLLGDRGEQIVLKFLADSLPAEMKTTLKWVARLGLTPGYDMEYKDKEGKMVAVEVKATSGPKFPSIEMTAGEWKAAKKLKEQYRIYMVVDCLTSKPKISCIQNPVKLVEKGKLSAIPTSWEIGLN